MIPAQEEQTRKTRKQGHSHHWNTCITEDKYDYSYIQGSIFYIPPTPLGGGGEYEKKGGGGERKWKFLNLIFI